MRSQLFVPGDSEKKMGKGQKEAQERMAIKALEEPPEMSAIAKGARFVGTSIRTELNNPKS